MPGLSGGGFFGTGLGEAAMSRLLTEMLLVGLEPVLLIPVEDLLGGADPGVLVLAGVAQRPVEMLQAVRRAQHVGLERNAHHTPLLAALALEPVEMVDPPVGQTRSPHCLAADH